MNPIPSPTSTWGFATEINDPLAPLRENPVSEEIIRPISELLMTDLLVSTGRARSIADSSFGVAIHGRRNLTLSWEPPNRYANEAATVRSISGEVKI